ncbi:MAG: hypothetical protein ACI4U6_05060 [Acutalibacteraceae bacterium]
MKKAKLILRKLLFPPKVVLCTLPTVASVALIFIFVKGRQESVSAYIIYFMAAYSLVILITAIVKNFKQIKAIVTGSKPINKISSYDIVKRYKSDMIFRGSFSLYQGMAVNLIYAIFRIVTGIIYSSVWFISMAVYYLLLGGMKAYLIYCYNRKKADSTVYEYNCYQKTAWMLLSLNIPMGGMIFLMIKTNSGFSYPGYIIYLSALYTFYIFGMSINNMVKYRKFESPILSAAKVLNFVSAMMSLLGLQTAMISQFSTNGDTYRRLMNTITGSFVYGIVVIVALYMMLNSAIKKKRLKKSE